MKAKVKSTGKSVNVELVTHHNPYIDTTYWWCKDTQTSYNRNELEFIEDVPELTKQLDIDWEKRRYELAKGAMNSILTAPIIDGVNPNPSAEDVTMYSVRLADALIKELKDEIRE